MKADEPADVPEPRANPYFTGHDTAEREFLQAWNGGRLAHAWLICGLRGIGKATLAYRMARHALANETDDLLGPAPNLAMSAEHPVFRRIAASSHADFRAIERGWSDVAKGKRKTVISVEEVRGIGSFLSMTPSEGGWRVVIIDAADEMNPNAANAVLKLLEEPPQRALLFLVAHRPEKLLPTIRSRCRRLDLRPLTVGNVQSLLRRYRPDLDESAVSALAVLADGSIGRALELAEEGGVALFRDLLIVLKDAPKLDAGRLHILGDQAMRGDAFRTLAELLSWWLARMIASGARGTNGKMPEIVPGEAAFAQKLLDAAPPAVWVDVWEQINTLSRRAEAINLDRKRSLMLMLWTVAQAMTKLPTAA